MVLLQVTCGDLWIFRSFIYVDNLKSATIIQCTIKGRFEESLVATFSKKPQHNINM